MNYIRKILLSTFILISNSVILAADFLPTSFNDDFVEVRKIMANMYFQQQQIEKEIDKMSASLLDEANQVKLFKYCKQPDCHQYSEFSYFQLTPDQNYTYQNTINDDGKIRSVKRTGKLTDEKDKSLIFNNANGQSDISYQP